MSDYLSKKQYLRLKLVLSFKDRLDEFNKQVFLVGDFELPFWSPDIKAQEAYDEYVEILRSLFGNTLNSKGSEVPSPEDIDIAWKEVAEIEEMYYQGICQDSIFQLDELLYKPTHKSSELDSNLMKIRQEYASGESTEWKSISKMSISYLTLAKEMSNLKAQVLGVRKEGVNKWIYFVLGAILVVIIPIIIELATGFFSGLIK